MSYDLGVVAIVKDEIAHIAEWVAFHEVVGVQQFYIYDNGSTDGTSDLLAALRNVSVLNWPGACQQADAYGHALGTFGDECQWLAFLDADEFLYSPEFRPVPSVLEDIRLDLMSPRLGAVGVCWATYGTSGFQAEPSRVISSFSRRAHLDDGRNRHVKSIIRKGYSASTAWDPHHFDVPTIDCLGRELHGPLVEDPTWERLRINHYWSGSVLAATRKAMTPRADTATLRSLEHFLDPKLNAVEDREIMAYAEALDRRLRRMF